MPRAILRSPNSWTVIDKADAQRLKLSAERIKDAREEDLRQIGYVLDNSIWIEQPLGQSWMLAFRVAYQRGGPVIAELRLFPHDTEHVKRPPGVWSGILGDPSRVPPGGITARLLREVRTTAFRKVLRELVARWDRQVMTAQPLPWAHPLKPASAKPKRGRPGRSDVELAQVARAYSKAYVSGQPPVPAVAKTFQLSRSQARDAIFRARAKGFLSPAAKQGTTGGLLTPSAKSLLATKGG